MFSKGEKVRLRKDWKTIVRDYSGTRGAYDEWESWCLDVAGKTLTVDRVTYGYNNEERVEFTDSVYVYPPIFFEPVDTVERAISRFNIECWNQAYDLRDFQPRRPLVGAQFVIDMKILDVLTKELIKEILEDIEGIKGGTDGDNSPDSSLG